MSLFSFILPNSRTGDIDSRAHKWNQGVTRLEIGLCNTAIISTEPRSWLTVRQFGEMVENDGKWRKRGAKKREKSGTYQRTSTRTPSGALGKRRKRVRVAGSQELSVAGEPSTSTETGSAGRRMRVTLTVPSGLLQTYEKL